MQVLNQGQEFLCFFVVGVIICFIFDLFRSSRYVFKTTDLITHIEDILFLLISATIIIASILFISSGILRFYIILAISMGILTYSLTISKLCVIIFSSIFKAIKFVVNIILERHLWKNFLNLKFIKYYLLH